MNWDESKIAALAPDEASFKAGRGLASPGKWQGLGQTGELRWGLCQGSGSKPYQTQADLAEPAFKCSCPSRKFPCKHALGLMLLAGAEPGRLESCAPPAWVREWLDDRAERAQKQAEKQELGEKPARRLTPEADARRRANVSAGLQELSLWMEDLLRRGLAGLPAESYHFFDQMAARLVDAQAPGLARWIRDLASLSTQGGNWTEQLLERLGLIQLLISGYQKLDALPPELQAEIRSQIGWTVNQEALAAEPGLADHWLVLGQILGFDDRLRFRRTWLLGRKSRRYALLLDFAFGNQPFKQNWIPGTSLAAEVVWYPASWPLRGLVKPGHALVAATAAPESFASWQELRGVRAQALAANPWTELLPACIGGLTPHLQIDGLWLRDARGDSLPVWQGFEQNWLLLALSGGHPLTLSFEFDGERAYPLGVWSEEGYQPLGEAAA